MVIVACGRMGPSTPWAAQPRGGSFRVICWIIVRSAPLIRRVVANRASPSMRTFTTSCCHSANRRGSVATAKTSSGVHAISIVETSGAIGSSLLPLIVLTRRCYDGWREGNVTVDGFEVHRSHLRSVAYRMLGTLGEADDAVQEAWLRLAHTDTTDIHNTRAWLTTVVARVCLDMLRSRKARHEVPLDTPLPAPSPDPEQEAMLADSVGLALLVVLETLTPAERLAFVLHDMFAVPFAEISPIVGRSPNATKMLASRARRRVRGAAEVPDSDPAHQREVVDAFLAASRGGDFGALLAVLDPDVVLRADGAAVRAGASREVRGARAVADTFFGRARFARPALVNGAIGAVWAPGGRPRVAFCFTVVGGKIVEIEVVADPARLSGLDLAVLED